jgi:putative transcriptional regulator
LALLDTTGRAFAPCLVGAVLALAAGFAGAELAPAAGRLLVAAEDLEDPTFSRAVVLMLHHDRDYGSVGLVINHRTDLSPAQVLTGVRGLERYRGNLFLGGPVEPRHVTVLAAGDEAGGDRVIDGVSLSTDPAALEALLDAGRVRDRDVRIFLGYAGWEQGQLDREIADGDWRVQPARAAQIFYEDPQGLWEALQTGAGGAGQPLRTRGMAGEGVLRPAAVLRARLPVPLHGNDRGCGLDSTAHSVCPPE